MKNQTITGTSRIVGILGNPVTHSLSPTLHNHLFSHYGLPFVYVPLGVEPHALKAAIDGLRALAFVGANVTIPYKSDILHHCDVCSPLSMITRTVNTLSCVDGKIHGTTTDAIGFFRALDHHGMTATPDDHVIILGNGGTARTLATAFAMEKKCLSLTIAARSFDKAHHLATEIASTTGFPVAACGTQPHQLATAARHSTLLVNCTSAGMASQPDQSPFPHDLFHRSMRVFDTIYNPARTPFLDNASAAGCLFANGLAMLLYQALASFTCWTGIEVDDSVISLETLQTCIRK